MKAQVSTAVAALAGAAVLATGAQAVERDPAAPGGAAAAQAGPPRIDQMVVFRSGKVVAGRESTARTTAKVGSRRCAIAAATPLAALLRSKPGPIAFHDYGSCTRKPADSSGLFVKSLRGERNRVQDGWVYKVGRKLATAGAADPSGPFGGGRLRSGDDVVWFYCRQLASGTCQRSLEISTAVDGREVTVTVEGFDDAGEGEPVAGATVRSGDERATTDGEGRAKLTLRRGSHAVHAAKRGTIRSFAKRVRIR
jgi:hypothetical protein